MKPKLYTLQFQPTNFLRFTCITLLACSVTFLWLIPSTYLYASYSITPLIIEQTAAPRDMFEESVKITNTTDRKLRIFPTVNQITLGDEGEIKEFIPASMSDNTTSVTSWIEVTRGRVEINPGETLKLPVMITINPNAKPGEYYVFLGLAEGSKRDEAEVKVMAGTAPGVVIRIELADTKNEYLRLSSYRVDRFVTDESKAQVVYEVENIGDITIVPRGEIILYDVRGTEVGSLSINTDEISVPPGERVSFTSPLPEVGFIGKFKAFLALEYGVAQAATIYDTTYFTVVPLQTLLITFAILLGVSLVSALYYHRTRLREDDIDEEGDVTMYVRPGVASTDKDHDINLKK